MDLDGDGVPRPEDCDDDDPSVGAPSTWYADVDGDGWGTSSTTVVCTQPSGFAALGGDCDDSDAAVSPAATEVCNGIDDDCNGITDGAESADATAWYQDADGDGYGEGSTEVYNCVAPGSDWVADGSDCDDEHDIAYPGNDEIWYDGIDGDCLGGDDYDQDGDGFQAESWGADCDDTDDWVNPDAEEACGDRIDNDCDGILTSCELEGAVEYQDAPALLLGERDDDQAGYSVVALGDVDGDGFDDLLVGAAAAETSTSYAGAAYLVHGPVSGIHRLSDVGIPLKGSQSGGYAARVVSGGSDLTGDGVYDLVVSHSNFWDPVSSGSASGALILEGPIEREFQVEDGGIGITAPYGSVNTVVNVVATHDIDGEAGADLALSTYGGSEPKGPTSHVYLFSSPFTVPHSVDDAYARISSETDTAGIGYMGRLAMGDDLTGDGLADVVAAHSGSRVYVISGSVEGWYSAGDAEVVLHRESTEDDFGKAIAMPGDLDGDGNADLMVGAPSYDRGGQAGSGAVYLFLGPLTAGTEPSDAAGLIVHGYNEDSFGERVSGAFDLTGDGRSEIIVSGYTRSGCGSSGRAAHVFDSPTLGTTDSTEALAWICGVGSYTVHGSAGDFDGDGVDDLFVGDPYTDVEGRDGGSVGLWFGGGE